MFICFFNQKTAYEMRISDWSSDVCSSDLQIATQGHLLFDIVNDGLRTLHRRRNRCESPIIGLFGKQRPGPIEIRRFTRQQSKQPMHRVLVTFANRTSHSNSPNFGRWPATYGK